MQQTLRSTVEFLIQALKSIYSENLLFKLKLNAYRKKIKKSSIYFYMIESMKIILHVATVQTFKNQSDLAMAKNRLAKQITCSLSEVFTINSTGC